LEIVLRVRIMIDPGDNNVCRALSPELFVSSQRYRIVGAFYVFTIECIGADVVFARGYRDHLLEDRIVIRAKHVASPSLDQRAVSEQAYVACSAALNVVSVRGSFRDFYSDSYVPTDHRAGGRTFRETEPDNRLPPVDSRYALPCLWRPACERVR